MTLPVQTKREERTRVKKGWQVKNSFHFCSSFRRGAKKGRNGGGQARKTPWGTGEGTEMQGGHEANAHRYLILGGTAGSWKFTLGKNWWMHSKSVARGSFLLWISDIKCSGCYSTVKQVTMSRLRRGAGRADNRGAQGWFCARGNAQLALGCEPVLRWAC